jgi:metal-dependent amidase/aminoacylase/carboxypeptidase family protein
MNRPAHTSDWLAGSHALQSDTVALRRAIHREPELGLETPKTLAKVRAALDGLPLTFKSGCPTRSHGAVAR